MNTNRPSSPLRSAFNFVVSEYVAYKIALVISVLVAFFGLILSTRFPRSMQSTVAVIVVVGAFLLFCFLWNRLWTFTQRHMDQRSADIEAQNRRVEWQQMEDWKERARNI